MFASIADKTYFLGIAPFLKFSGFSESSIMPIISIGMVPEIAAMFILYTLIKRFGYKNILSAGIVAHILRFILFIISSESSASYLIIPGILLHGLTFAFYVAVAYIFLDTFCTENTRSTMHLLYAFAVSGTGNSVGNIIGGILMDYSLFLRGNYTLFWLFPALVSAASFIMLRRKITSG
jgi:MFS family permease